MKRTLDEMTIDRNKSLLVCVYPRGEKKRKAACFTCFSTHIGQFYNLYTNYSEYSQSEGFFVSLARHEALKSKAYIEIKK